MVFTVLAIYYVMSAGMNPLQLVLVGTVVEATVFIFEIPTGVVADTYSRRLSVIIGYALIGICYLITGLAPIFIVILAAEFIRGVGETFISGATSAWITDELGEGNVGDTYVCYQQFSLAGGFLGILAGAGLGVLELSIPILLGGAGVVMLAIFLLLTMQEHGVTPTPADERETWRDMADTARAGLSVIRLQPVVLMFVLAGVFYGAASEGFDRLWEVHYLQNIQFPATPEWPVIVWIGIINAGAMLIGILFSESLIRRMSLDNARTLSRVLLLSTALLMASVIAFGFAQGFLVATLIYWFSRGLRALQYPISQTWLNRNIPSRVRATVLSMVAQTDAFGQVAGGPVVGAVGLRSLRAAMVFSGFLIAPAVLLFGRGARRTEGETTVSE